MDQHGVALGRIGALEQIGPDGEQRLGQRRRLDHRQRVRARAGTGRQAPRNIRHSRRRRAARRPAGRASSASDALAHRDDRAGDLQPEDRRTRPAAADSGPCAGARRAGSRRPRRRGSELRRGRARAPAARRAAAPRARQAPPGRSRSSFWQLRHSCPRSPMPCAAFIDSDAVSGQRCSAWTRTRSSRSAPTTRWSRWPDRISIRSRVDELRGAHRRARGRDRPRQTENRTRR